MRFPIEPEGIASVEFPRRSFVQGNELRIRSD